MDIIVYILKQFFGRDEHFLDPYLLELRDLCAIGWLQYLLQIFTNYLQFQTTMFAIYFLVNIHTKCGYGNLEV